MRKKVTFNPELIKEEAKRFKLLTEYTFYQEENVMAPSATAEKPIILGNKLEEVEGEEEETVDQAAGLEDETPAPEGEEIPAEEEMPAPDEEMPAEEPATDEELPEPPPPGIEPEETDTEEIDVTSLVKGADDAKKAAITAMKVSKETGDDLMDKLSDLEAKLARMDSVANKIEDLEKELVKRNPTPVEKLEMRSLSSYPYNIKLSDYWSDKEGQYDVMNKEPKEYVLTKDDVDNEFSYSQIKDTFDEPSEEQEYEEEDI
jgi:hypothetical protein